jgi:uracil-DNA glycosylase family 4
MDIYLEMKNILTSNLYLQLEKSYTKTCLPITASMAKQSRRKLNQSLGEFPEDWPFMDKVLVIFDPSFMDEVRRFHTNNGPRMTEMYQKSEIKTIDKTLIARLNKFLEEWVSPLEVTRQKKEVTRQRLAKIVNKENKSNPLADEEIAVKLNEMGSDMARRTVTKYRRIMKIPSSRERKCDLCIKAKTNSHLFSGNIKLWIKPIRGANPLIMLVGQDPTIAKGQVYSVLDLENTSGTLYKYITDDILNHAGLTLNNIYATNLIKCQFPDNQTPKTISEKHKVKMKDFLFPFFNNCKHWFFKEVHEIRPKIILSLGEPVHQLLIEEFSWNVPMRMKDAFSNFYKVNILNNNVLYIPCIHINTRGHRHYKERWQKFILNLKKAGTSLV